MNECFEQNLLAIAKRYPDLSKRLSQVSWQDIQSSFQIKDTGGSLQLLEGGRVLDSTAQEYSSWEASSPTAVRVAILEGFGMGSGLKWILERLGRERKDIIVIEPNILSFAFALTQTQYQTILSDESIHWMVGTSPSEFFTWMFHKFNKPPRALYFEASQYYRHPILGKTYSGLFDVFRDEWMAVGAAIKRGYGSLEDTLIGVRYTIENTTWIKKTPGLLRLKTIHEKFPAIICSAGPSLKKSLPLVKELQDRALIIAVDASLSVCLEAGVEPHLVCSLERHKNTLPFFEALKKFEKPIRTQLVAFPIVPPEVISAFPGKSWVVFRDHVYHRLMDQKLPRGSLHSGTSVAHFALRIADYLGACEIVLVGQDLAYDPDTFQSHVEGVAYQEWAQAKSEAEVNQDLKKRDQGQVIYLPGNLEEKVPSSGLWFTFGKEFGWEVSQIKAKTWNATDGGAQIPGVAWRRLEKISEDWKERYSFFDKIEAARKEQSAGDWNWNEVKAMVTEIQTRLTRLKAELSSVLGTDPQARAGLFKQVLPLFQSSKIGLESMPGFWAFILEMNAREYIDIENHRNLISERDPEYHEKHLQLLLKWFSAMNDACNRFLQLL